MKGRWKIIKEEEYGGYSTYKIHKKYAFFFWDYVAYRDTLEKAIEYVKEQESKSTETIVWDSKKNKYE